MVLQTNRLYLRHSHTSEQTVAAATVRYTHSFEPALADRPIAENPTTSAPKTAIARPKSDESTLAIRPRLLQNEARVSFGGSVIEILLPVG
jgi:hypothetical protein